MNSGEVINSIHNLRQRYGEQYALRSVVQAIPSVGATIDTLITGGYANVQIRRTEKLIENLSDRLKLVEKISADVDGEEFGDLIFSAFEKSSKTRSDIKRKRFAEIIAKQLIESHSWSDPEDAVRLLSELEDIHVEILGAVLKAPLGQNNFQNKQVLSLEHNESLLSIEDTLSHHPIARLRMASAQLVSSGLLHDEGIGRLGTSAMEFFVPTDLAKWFGSWISLGD